MIQSIVKFSQIEERFDAEYYKPEFVETERLLEKLSFTTQLKEVASKERARRNPENEEAECIRYLDIANVDLTTGEVALQTISKYLAPSRARRGVKIGDIAISTVRPIRNAIAFISDELQDIVCSTGFAIITPKKIDSFYLFTFLKTNYAINQLVRRTSAAMYPAVSEDEVFNIKIPVPTENIQKKIGGLANLSFQKSTLAKEKYQEAKKLVEDFLKIGNENFTFSNTFALPVSKIEDRFDGEYYQPLKLLDLPMFQHGYIPLGELTAINAGKTPAKQAYTSKGVRILKVRDLTNQGIDWEEGDRAYTLPEVFAKTKKARVQENDLLLISAAHLAYYIGKEIDIVFDIPKEFDNKLLAVGELLIVRAGKINPYVLLWYMRTKVAYLLIQRLITGETSHLYAKDLITLPIPKILIDFEGTGKIEKLTKEAMNLKRESKELLEQAKSEIEKIIENG
jgi:hypothetical protein